MGLPEIDLNNNIDNNKKTTSQFQFDMAKDVWSFGLMLYNIWGRPPPGKDIDDWKQSNLTNVYQVNRDKETNQQ